MIPKFEGVLIFFKLKWLHKLLSEQAVLKLSRKKCSIIFFVVYTYRRVCVELGELNR